MLHPAIPLGDRSSPIFPKMAKPYIDKTMTSANRTWGRNANANIVGSAIGIFGCTILVNIYWIALEYFDGSLSRALSTVLSEVYQGKSHSLLALLPKPSLTGALIYLGWIVFQGLLFYFLPGRTCYGQRTPGGHRLRYVTNGLIAWAITHLLFFLAVHQGWIETTVVAKNWQGLLIAASAYGYALAVGMQVKGYYMATFPEDCKSSSE